MGTRHDDHSERSIAKVGSLALNGLARGARVRVILNGLVVHHGRPWGVNAYMNASAASERNKAIIFAPQDAHTGCHEAKNPAPRWE